MTPEISPEELTLKAEVDRWFVTLSVAAQRIAEAAVKDLPIRGNDRADYLHARRKHDELTERLNKIILGRTS